MFFSFKGLYMYSYTVHSTRFLFFCYQSLFIYLSLRHITPDVKKTTYYYIYVITCAFLTIKSIQFLMQKFLFRKY